MGTMKFYTDFTITASNNLEVNLPDMTHKFMVPHRITIVQLKGSRDDKSEENVKDVQCRVFTGSTELCNLSEVYFQLDNVIDLDKFWGMIERIGRIRLHVMNKSRDPRDFRVYTEYRSCKGGVIYQEKTDRFDNVIENVVKAGRCTMLNMTFDKKLSSLEFLTTSSCVDGDWIESIGADIDENSKVDEVYSFDFTDDELNKYIDELKYIKLQVRASEDVSVNAYVSAYGFLHK